MIAYTRRLSFDVLAAPLAEIDRRTLSQAWYSALHLGAASAPPAPARARPAASPRGGLRATAVAHRDGARIASAASRGTAARAQAALPAEAERRAPRSDLGRRIVRLASRPAPPGGAASFGLRAPCGRVQILVRSIAGRLHVVAVCSPRARAEVARALEEARYALARGGVALRALELREELP